MIQLSLPYPISANRYWRTSTRGSVVRTHVSVEAQVFREACAWTARAAGVREPLDGWLAMEITVHPVEPKSAAARRRREGPDWHLALRCIDIGNAEKVTADALQGVCYRDDAQIVDIRIKRGLPVNGGGMTVVISQVSSEAPGK